mmetsp:Transcript_3214/g.7337  ORF Transcript_3214/g.7337 Transcript_3214/m.7337 type:complete len:336 (-) Transcript_3214:79-1086(-)
MSFVVQTEKGDKGLLLFLQSAIRRWFKYAFLCGIGAVIVSLVIVGKSSDYNEGDSSPIESLSSLRSTNIRATIEHNGKTKNIALRPRELLPDPTEWISLTLDAMTTDYLMCDFEKERSIHDADTWVGMREAYISVVGRDAATVELDASRTFETAFRLPFEVRQSPGKGRGIFALKDVLKGELLYDFSQSAQFRKRSEFAEFLRILQPALACDVVMWSYVQYFGKGALSVNSEDYKSQIPDLRIVTDLDPGSFCNNGYNSNGNMAWLNSNGTIAVGVIGDGTTDNPQHAKITRKNGSVRKDAVKAAPLVAVRNIQEGDELLCIYDQFSEGLNLMIE